jgi:hypothetical protein
MVPTIPATVITTESPPPALVPVAHIIRVFVLQESVLHAAYKEPYKAEEPLTSRGPKFTPCRVKLEPEHAGPFDGELTVKTGASNEKEPAEVPTTPAMLTDMLEDPVPGGMPHLSCVKLDHCVVMHTRKPSAMVGV